MKWQIVPRAGLPASLYDEIVALCDEAYGEDFSALMASYEGATHVLGFEAGRPVAHALWVEAEVEAGGGAALRTAVVEAVATRPDRRHRGLGREAMRRLVEAVTAEGYDIAALTPFDARWYARLGWELWRGPLYDREEHGLEPSTGHELMILRLPRTPPLDLDGPLVVD